MLVGIFFLKESFFVYTFLCNCERMKILILRYDKTYFPKYSLCANFKELKLHTQKTHILHYNKRWWRWREWQLLEELKGFCGVSSTPSESIRFLSEVTGTCTQSLNYFFISYLFFIFHLPSTSFSLCNPSPSIYFPLVFYLFIISLLHYTKEAFPM